MCQRGGLLGAVASTWREIDTSSSWTKNSTHFSLAWLSLGAPVLLLLYMVEGSFSAVIPGTPDQDQRLESHQNATSGSAGLRGWLDGGTAAKGGWRGAFTSSFWRMPTLIRPHTNQENHFWGVDSSRLNPSRAYVLGEGDGNSTGHQGGIRGGVGGGGGGGVGRQSNVDPGRVTAGTQGPAPLAPRARHHHRCQLSHRGERGNEHLLLIQQKLQTIK